MNPHKKEKKEKYSLSAIPERVGMKEALAAPVPRGLEHAVFREFQHRCWSTWSGNRLQVNVSGNFLHLFVRDFIGVWHGPQSMITDVIYSGFSFRGDKERALSSSGLLEMGDVREITVTVMGTQTASTPSPSAVPRSKAYPPGMLRSAPPHWPPRTAVGITPTSESYVALLSNSLCLCRRAWLVFKRILWLNWFA